MTEDQEFFDRAALEVAGTIIATNPKATESPDTVARQAAAIARALLEERRAFANEQPKGYPGPNG